MHLFIGEEVAQKPLSEGVGEGRACRAEKTMSRHE